MQVFSSGMEAINSLRLLNIIVGLYLCQSNLVSKKMTYSEAENIMAKHIDAMRTKLFFRMGGQHCMFIGLIAAPENSSLEFKEMLYAEVIKNGVIDRTILLEN